MSDQFRTQRIKASGRFLLDDLFWHRQFKHIRDEGFAAVRRKLSILLKKIKLFQLPLYLVAFPIVCIVRLVRPLIWIRFGEIISDAIGHFVFDTEYYLSEREIENLKTIDCFYFTNNKIRTNKCWELMVKKKFRVNPLFQYLDDINQIIPGGRMHNKNACDTGSRDIYGFVSGTKTHFNFTDYENEMGYQFLHSLGLERDHQFVCLLVRDSAYKAYYQKSVNNDLSYQNFRNSEISDYEDTICSLAERGYWVFRMGKKVHKPLKINDTRIIDYANSKYRSDFLDIWLMANCFFTISTACGLDEVSFLFKRPIAFVNADVLGLIHTTSNPKSIWLPKKIIWGKNKKPLTLKEQIENNIIGLKRVQHFKDAGVELIDNTPEEITKTVLELEAKLTNKWEYQSIDEVHQEQFWQRLQTWERFTKWHGKTKSKMPDTFLRENHEWFLA